MTLNPISKVDAKDDLAYIEIVGKTELFEKESTEYNVYFTDQTGKTIDVTNNCSFSIVDNSISKILKNKITINKEINDDIFQTLNVVYFNDDKKYIKSLNILCKKNRIFKLNIETSNDILTYNSSITFNIFALYDDGNIVNINDKCKVLSSIKNSTITKTKTYFELSCDNITRDDEFGYILIKYVDENNKEHIRTKNITYSYSNVISLSSSLDTNYIYNPSKIKEIPVTFSLKYSNNNVKDISTEIELINLSEKCLNISNKDNSKIIKINNDINEKTTILLFAKYYNNATLIEKFYKLTLEPTIEIIDFNIKLSVSDIMWEDETNIIEIEGISPIFAAKPIITNDCKIEMYETFENILLNNNIISCNNIRNETRILIKISYNDIIKYKSILIKPVTLEKLIYKGPTNNIFAGQYNYNITAQYSNGKKVDVNNSDYLKSDVLNDDQHLVLINDGIITFNNPDKNITLTLYYEYKNPNKQYQVVSTFINIKLMKNN